MPPDTMIHFGDIFWKKGSPGGVSSARLKSSIVCQRNSGRTFMAVRIARSTWGDMLGLMFLGGTRAFPCSWLMLSTGTVPVSNVYKVAPKA